MVRISEDLIRKRAEHNEGQLSNLEEVSLHQQDIERIEHIDKWCRDLKILYLQSNLIPKIENISRLKKLEYINLALNNIERVENLEACESLQKLDLTVNFVGELTSIECLRDLQHFQQLYLTGNPCTEFEYYKDYVIATLPHLKYLDGQEISRSDRIKAVQVYDEAKRRIREQEMEYQTKRLKEKELETERTERKEKYKKKHGFDGRWYTDINDSETNCKEEDGHGDLCDKDNFNEEDKKFWDEKVPFTPESRLEVHAQVKKQRERAQKDADDQTVKRVRRLVADDGRILNVNEGKIDFTLTDDFENNKLTLNLETYRFLDTSLIDVDVQPTYVRATIKGKIFQLLLPEEVNADSSCAKRSQITGHLMIEMPKAKQHIKCKKPVAKSLAKNEEQENKSYSGQRYERLEVDTSGQVDLHIVRDVSSGQALPVDRRPQASVPERANSEDFVDDPNVPPLE